MTPRADDLIARIVDNKKAIFKYMFIPQALAGFCLLALGYHMGHDHFRLIRSGVRTAGRIVAFREVILNDRDPKRRRRAFMPIVEFHDNGRTLQFQDWLGSSSQAGFNTTVSIIYDSGNPSIAMIDRRIWNWLPWAPTFLLGVFLSLVACKGWVNLRMRNGSA